MKIINAVQDAIMLATLSPQSSFTAAFAECRRATNERPQTRRIDAALCRRCIPDHGALGSVGVFEDGARWCQSTFDPTWSTVLQYRRKARTITVDGVELPAPETEAPAYGTKIYFINPFNRSVVESRWSGDATDTLTYLKNGQTFLHRDHAQQWADFIVSTMTRGREKGDE